MGSDGRLPSRDHHALWHSRLYGHDFTARGGMPWLRVTLYSLAYVDVIVRGQRRQCCAHSLPFLPVLLYLTVSAELSVSSLRSDKLFAEICILKPSTDGQAGYKEGVHKLGFDASSLIGPLDISYEHLPVSHDHRVLSPILHIHKMVSASTHLGFSAFLAFAFPSPFTCNLAARAERTRQRRVSKQLISVSEKC
ncbi:hypothetical protein CALCODRAFT_501173 [Calocera cornea HHB12733]|uniref:Uncharacterized protein n=1 Tax=Calocera cornea HHB12733 TaxID=1353952 RepID=A0A165DR62_9BASI|nr:hypothetical protein CALCODRAFT_501173 [Calocera cornea HHB12733]